MKHIMIVALYFLLGQEAYSQDKWAVDPSHSSVQFIVDHLVVSEVAGSFSDFEGTLTMEGDDFTTASFNGEVQVKSINTGNSQRDNHLLGSDFFASSDYPVITFESGVIEKKDDKYLVKGLLTMKGKTNPVEMEVDYKGQVKFMGQMKAGLKATTTINRFDFGLNWNSMLETGGAVVGKEIDITLNMELVKR